MSEKVKQGSVFDSASAFSPFWSALFKNLAPRGLYPSTAANPDCSYMMSLQEWMQPKYQVQLWGNEAELQRIPITQGKKHQSTHLQHFLYKLLETLTGRSDQAFALPWQPLNFSVWLLIRSSLSLRQSFPPCLVKGLRVLAEGLDTKRLRGWQFVVTFSSKPTGLAKSFQKKSL